LGSRDYGHRRYNYAEPCYGYVTNVYPIDSMRRLFVDVTPLDNRGLCTKVPIVGQPGFTSTVRLNMTVRVDYINGNPQYPIITGHTYNSESPGIFHDPLPAHHEQIDDVSMHNDTTALTGSGGWAGVFIRARSVHSTDAKVAPDGSPGILEIGFPSGMLLSLFDHDPPGYTANPTVPPGQKSAPPPPKPVNAQASLTMPNGLTIVVDESAQGSDTTTVTLTHPSGASMMCDPDGNWSIVAASGKMITIEESGGSPMALAFLESLEALVTTFNSHMHTGVQSGGSTSGMPVTPAAAAMGTTNTVAS
jgi:hypothetical protein